VRSVDFQEEIAKAFLGGFEQKTQTTEGTSSADICSRFIRTHKRAEFPQFHSPQGFGTRCCWYGSCMPTSLPTLPRPRWSASTGQPLSKVTPQFRKEVL
jgi:hypothetical protein